MRHAAPEIDLASHPKARTSSPSHVATRNVVIVGAGGHGRELADIVKAVANHDATVSLLGVVDDGTPDLGLLARSGIRYIGPVSAIIDRPLDLMIGIGDPSTRESVDRAVPDLAGAALCHPTAIVGAASSLASGVVLAQRAIVTTNVAIGRHTHVNVGASISHDCVIGDYVTISPGATLAGAVSVGDRAFIGIGATVLPGVTIAADAFVAAGAVVCADVSRGVLVRGIPARAI